MINYTFSERTKKNHTVGEAINRASDIYKGAICLDMVDGRSYDTLVTLPEFNDLVEAIISDSAYWDICK